MVQKESLFSSAYWMVLVVLCSVVPVLGMSEVRIWQEPLTIPTYVVDKPDSDPMFYKGDAYQGAKKVIYPYPFLDKVTDIRKDKTYNAVYLENKYVKLCFLPEVGGRLFSAVDKTNNYDFFYRQHVIKPALIGMLGAWISGGIEWCVLHHHRATTFMPVDYTLAKNLDGSKTLWFGEIERRHRMKWIIGATLYPDRSYMEVTVKIFNRTPFPNSFLYWANVAVHANNNYQVIFPPSVNYATYHAKNDFAHWPIAYETYRGIDYNGVDLSWWKNHPEPVSFFAWDLKEDFSGGYDHGNQAGVVHVANHHVVVGAKLWEWSPGPQGRMWDKILTETDGPYAELMVGAYSDNQPDYSWIKPYEVKTFTQCWYPIREIGGFKNANKDAAVNLVVTEKGTARIGFNTTTRYSNANVLLTAAGKTIFTQRADIAPDKPFEIETPLPAGVEQTDLEVSLFSADRKRLISYRPVKKEFGPKLPETVKAPPAPKDIKTIEELYLAGLRIEQFHNPTLDPHAYYEEALKRDPGDSRVNTILGIDYNRRGLFDQAEEKLRTAIRRISKDYTRPVNAEAYFHLGFTLKSQGKYDEAYDSFYRATWDYAFHSAGFYQLAELSCRRADYAKALEQLDHSLSTNTLNTKAFNLKAAVLRKLGRFKESIQIAQKTAGIDPLDFWAMNELYLAESESGAGKARRMLHDLTVLMRGDVQSYLELAVDYGNCGLWDNAIDVLSRLDVSNQRQASTYPMVYYYLGYFWENKADREKAQKYYKLASRMPHEYCFPFRLESLDVLRAAIKSCPEDSRVHYYLGCLLYDKQPENAITEWEKARTLDETFALVHRNLGWGYYRFQGDISKAIVSYEKAVSCTKDDPRLYYELDVLCEVGGIPAAKRLRLFEENHEVVARRDDSLSREISLYVQTEQYDKAVELLTSHHFHTWEGGGEIHDVYVDAHLLRGSEQLKAGKFRDALADFEAAGEYPENLEVGRPKNDSRARQVWYFIGTAHEALGENEKAREFYSKVADQQRTFQWPQARYFQGLALGKLGRKEDAEKIFDSLVSTWQKRVAEDVSMDFFAKFGERQSKESRLAEAHYIIGLGYLGQGRPDKAKGEFEQAVQLNVNHLWARVELSNLK